jgi:RNA polymerase sigma-70 factor (ECF subfamily)
MDEVTITVAAVVGWLLGHINECVGNLPYYISLNHIMSPATACFTEICRRHRKTRWNKICGVNVYSNRDAIRSAETGYRMRNQFKDIALAHFNALYGFALSLAADHRDAEDLVQETYLRAYRKFEQFDFGTSCKAWLFRIMRNIAIDRVRKKDPLWDTGGDASTDELACMQVEADHLACAIDIKNAFNALPPEYRIIVLLKDIEGFTYQEIAGILNFPIGTVMSRLHRGRKALKSILSDKRPQKIKKNVVELRK